MKLAHHSSALVLGLLAGLVSLPACSGGGGGGGSSSGTGGLTNAGWADETVDFETLTPGMVVSQAFGSLGTGPIAVSGSSTALPGQNAAVVFDSGNRTGGDTDLGTPNTDFGGPGVGAGGASGSPFQNDRALGHLLIVAENLDDANMDGIVDDPDDGNDPAATIEFDFSAFGTARVSRLTVIDIDINVNPEIELFDAAGASLLVAPIPTTGDNGVATVDLGPTAGVTRMVVRLNGSGAIDELTFKKECSGKIGDFVWHDLNRDGIQDAGEPGIQGVSVVLEDLGGIQLLATITDMNGLYAFTDVCAGDYVVRVDEGSLPPGFVASPCDAGADDTADNDCSPALVSLLTDDAYDPTIDFGYNAACTGAIGDFVWHDLNRDGIQDAGEPGIAGVELLLCDAAGSNIAMTTTDADGGYAFNGLCAGTYVVKVDDTTLPEGFVPSECDAGMDDMVDNDCSGVTVVLMNDGERDPTIDFGFNAACTGKIGDFVWHDLNRDGLQDEGEPGIEGVTILLKDKLGNALARDITGRAGEYEFTGLCAGEYLVEVDEETVPMDFEPSRCDAGDDDAIDNDCSPVCVVLDTDDEEDDTIDFAYVGVCESKIGDFVWHDLNRDGIQDEGEPGIMGVTVTLKDDLGVTLATQTTDEDGLYSFTGLCAGSYKVEVDPTTLPPGFEPAPCNVGDDDEVDNDCSPAMVDLEGDMVVDLSIDFGFLSACTGKIGDFIWYDKNCDGLQDELEPGLEGVLVRLKNSMGEVLGMTVTDENGFYEFMGLCAGKYIVEVDPRTLPDDLQPSECNVGDDDTIDNDCSPACIELVDDDEQDDSVDFGYKKPFEGCTPGYWKQPHHFDSWPAGLEPEMLFSEVFDDAFPDMTLVEVLGQGGGGIIALGRHAVAALLNAGTDGVNYPLAPEDVVDMFNDAFDSGDTEDLKDYFESFNEAGCPLN